MQGIDNLNKAGESDLSGLNDVAISSPSNGQTLKYNSQNEKWENSESSSNNYGVFVDVNNVIKAQTAIPANTTATYTATEDCYLLAILRKDGDASSLVYVDGEQLGGIYTSTGYATDLQGFFIKKGQVVTITVTSESHYTVYGIQGGTKFIGLADCYSTTEKQIGVWRDNKPLYQRTFVFETPLAVSYSSFTDTTIDSTDIENIVDNHTTHADGTNYGSLIADPTRQSHTKVGLQTNRNGNNANVKTLTIRYTKISDVAGSEIQLGANLADLDDTNIASPSNGDILKYNSTSHKWENTSGGSGGASSLADLDDTDIASPSDGDILRYDSYSQKWLNNQISYYNINDKPTINYVTIEGDLSFSDLGMDEYYVSTDTLGDTLADYAKKTVDDEDLTIETDSGYNMYLTSSGDMEIGCSGSLALNFDTTDGYNIQGNSDGLSFNGAGEGNIILGCNENTFTLNSGTMSVNGESLSINVNGNSGSSSLSASDSGVSITGNNHIILNTNEEHPSTIEIGQDISIGSVGDVMIEAGTSSYGGDYRIILNAMQGEYSGRRNVYIQTSHGQTFGDGDAVAALRDIMRAIGYNHEFDKNNSYNVDDIVFWCDENGCGMFKFVSPHSSGDDWSDNEVTQIDIIDYINGQ